MSTRTHPLATKWYHYVREECTYKSTQNAQFSSLPVEVKEQIYSYTIGEGQRFHVTTDEIGGGDTYKLPPICLTSKLERTIAIRVLLRNTIISLSQLRRRNYDPFARAIRHGVK
ncbi:hypothetical protein CC86DRAFT_385032 [Ophiobolus disseminans]|uniref:Uncharacterized protein n=1 Tax=Ophiobolus disseminans TaxID=1469910 RepID=A0A6A6ZPT9_9PLEO|nr:hypothetical protein CC86DRAFT_385032 [Ophiobolus disseminans]